MSGNLQPISGAGDTRLIALGRELISAQEALERAGDHKQAMAILDRIETICEAMVDIRADSVVGLCWKARATAWAIEDEIGNLNPKRQPNSNLRVSASIVRDLLQLPQPK